MGRGECRTQTQPIREIVLTILVVPPELGTGIPRNAQLCIGAKFCGNIAPNAQHRVAKWEKG